MIHTPARDITANPAPYADQPALLQDAWAELKAKRGQSVRFDRIGDPQHVIDRHSACDGIDDLAHNRLHRIRARIAAHVQATGITGPAPLICKGAAK
jgi:hypothetical protein